MNEKTAPQHPTKKKTMKMPATQTVDNPPVDKKAPNAQRREFTPRLLGSFLMRITFMFSENYKETGGSASARFVQLTDFLDAARFQANEHSRQSMCRHRYAS